MRRRVRSPRRRRRLLFIASHDVQRARFLPSPRGLPPLSPGTNQATERREARMYVGLGTILLIVLIIILLIWVF
jgi:hypothetical protein